MNEKIENIEVRLSNLERKIDQLLGATAPRPPSQPQAALKPIPPKPAPPITFAPGTQQSVSQLLPLIAVICFVLAGVFMVRLAIESGWLTAERQWALLTLLGIALTATGRWFEKIEKDYRAYLSAAGIIVLYISAFSSSLYFGIFPAAVSLVAAIGVSAICLLLFKYHRSDLFPVLTSVGTYLSPVLLGEKGDIIFVAAFFILWAMLFSTIANYLKTRVLSLTSAYLGIGVFSMIFAMETDPSKLTFIICVLVIQFFCFAVGVYAYTTHYKEPMTENMAMAYLPVLLFFYGTTYYFMDRLNPGLAPWISLAFAGIVYLLYRGAKKEIDQLHSQKMIEGFLGVVIFHSGYMQILPDTAKPWLLPILVFLRYISEKKSDFPKVSIFLQRMLMAIAAIEFGKMCYQLIQNSSQMTLFPAVMTLALGMFYYFNMGQKVQDKVFLMLSLIHLLAILSLYRIAYDFGSLAVSAAWAIYSAVILTVGYQRKDAPLAKSSLVVLIAASIKALVYDSSQAPSMIRIASLLVTGALLYGAGLIFRRIQKWQN